MKIALLDTNVLLALAWPNHQHHAQAHAWFNLEAKNGWATCAIGHQQVNDAWLVEVTRRNSGRLVTLDIRLPAHARQDGCVEVIQSE